MNHSRHKAGAQGCPAAARRTLAASAAALVALLAAAPGAPAGEGAGYNKPSRALEGAFKIALLERKESAAGCYPAPDQLAAAIRSRGNQRARVAAAPKAVKRRNVVHVVRAGAACGQLRMALRDRVGLWVLNSAKGSLVLKDTKRRRRSDKQAPGGSGPLRALTLRQKSFTLTAADEVQRLSVLCPRKRFPLGGGLKSTPFPGIDGEGIYPHSYERLGVQRGWHINPVLLDPAPGTTVARRVTLQVVCGKGLVPTSAPHKTVFVKPGQTKTAVARCPKGSVLMSGGFQRTNFRSQSGNYPTESRAAGPRAWRVSGSAHGADGGELTAIAYCDRSKRPLLKTRSATTTIPAGQSATATTPKCPRGWRLTVGGFSMGGAVTAFYQGGWFNRNGSWSAAGFGYFGAAASFTAYGYCLKKGR